MEQSATYRAIFRKGYEQGRLEGREEGRAEEARRLLLLIGKAQLGPPDPSTLGALHRVGDVEQLEEMAVRLLNAASWQDLLPLPARRRKTRA